MTREDRSRLAFPLLEASLGALALAALPVLAAFLVWRSLAVEGFLGRGELLVILPLFAFWEWLLRRSPQRLLHIIADLRSGAVAEASGLGVVAARRGIGLIAPESRRLILGDIELSTDGFPQHKLQSKAELRVRYAARSKIVLSVGSQDDRVNGAIRPVLTDRERELLALLAEGLTDKLIARRLALTPATVRTYNSSLFKKLGASGRKDAVDAARCLGFFAVN